MHGDCRLPSQALMARKIEGFWSRGLGFGVGGLGVSV